MEFGNPNNESFLIIIPDKIMITVQRDMIPEILFSQSLLFNFYPHELHSNFFLDL